MSWVTAAVLFCLLFCAGWDYDAFCVFVSELDCCLLHSVLCTIDLKFVTGNLGSLHDSLLQKLL
jgi:hypothetical protein